MGKRGKVRTRPQVDGNVCFELNLNYLEKASADILCKKQKICQQAHFIYFV